MAKKTKKKVKTAKKTGKAKASKQVIVQGEVVLGEKLITSGPTVQGQVVVGDSTL